MIPAALSFAAGLLTVLAPCVLPLLPVIVGGSMDAGGDRWRPYVISGSLVASLLWFTLLLKATSLLINVDPLVWAGISGGLVMALGLAMLLPGWWTWLLRVTTIERRSQGALVRAAGERRGMVSAVLTGAALGPVFSSCSPTYAWVLATVLPTRLGTGLLLLGIYSLGLAASLLAIALFGRRLLSRMRWASDPRGWFQRGIAVLFLLVGLALVTGSSQRVQLWVDANLPSGVARLEQRLVPGGAGPGGTIDQSGPNGAMYNVHPYPAPDFARIQTWINSPPLTMADLRGKVVLVDFWTYSCINCLRTQPYLNAWYSHYRAQGFVVVGVHAPEFSFERVAANVRTAVRADHIAYPVALDNSFATWSAFGNQYWPGDYLIDRTGQVRYVHFGEGDYDTTEATIRALLGSSGPAATVPDAGSPSQALRMTPETYLGTDRADSYVGTPPLTDGTAAFTASATLDTDQWTIAGTWTASPENLVAGPGALLLLNFSGDDVYLVVTGPVGARIDVRVNGAVADRGPDVRPDGTVVLDGPRLYHLVHSDRPLYGSALRLRLDPGIGVNAFTFG
ncbi:MAG TPA: cytochrome c biogenesis protein CcdA [Propionibacteriaceae bacterium]|nr:cytochrome c biogenesis protein CcdA [Propionibacteriaceae bacterium]